MQKINNQYIHSSIDLITFLSCNYATLLKVKQKTQKLVSNNTNKTSQLFTLKGLEHEKQYLKFLKNNGRQVIEISTKLQLKERITQTKHALHQGIEIIYQGVLYSKVWRGNLDFLIKCNQNSKLGNYSYEVLDTKLSQKVKTQHIIQLCIYSELLKDIQGNMPRNMYIYLGDGQLHNFDIKDYIYYYKYAKRKFLKFFQDIPKNLYPEPCSHCNICKWKINCKDKWHKDDHLSLVANITKPQRKTLTQCNIDTMKNLAMIEKTHITPLVNRKVFSQLREQAKLQHKKIITRKNKYQIIFNNTKEGFMRIPEIDPSDIFFDIEGDPLYPNGLEYLFGIYYSQNNKEVFKVFWAHNHQEEEKAFIQYINFIKTHLKKHPNAHIYHYNHYETTALKKLSCKYSRYENQLDTWFQKKVFIDLYLVIRESIRISEPGYSIKNLETFYMNKRTDSINTAIDSIVVYNNWRIIKKKKLLEEIVHYNHIDCISTYLLRNWLLTLKLEKPNWPITRKQNTRIQQTNTRNWTVEYYEYKKKLHSIYPDKKKNIILVHLLEFHRRESKPTWWNIFDRQNKYTHEIIEDIECLGGLKLATHPYKKNTAFFHVYHFPQQETKLKKRNRILNVRTIKQVGSISNIYEMKNVVTIQSHLSSKLLPTSLSIGPNTPIDNKLLRAALYRCIHQVIKNTTTVNCINDLLQRTGPKIKNKVLHTPIFLYNSINTIIDIITHMSNTYLFIQGPPGTGKTYISSHVIVELIKKGKKIGVTSNSHKAIHNLLNRVENIAKEKKFAFTGVKKASLYNKESYFQGFYIHNMTATNDILLETLLFAGTAWLFANPLFTKQLDYLFIDEAGQVALANTIAMSTSAKNIVLIGDQMQLKQPIQGAHPRYCNFSVLEYLLGNNSTTTTEKGIFLSKSRRLTYSICNFISNTFYNSYLIPHKNTEKIKLDIQDCHFPHQGVKFINVNCYNTLQKNIEESYFVLQILNKLLTQGIYDNGMTKQIMQQDILVVSPYNVQVNYLQSILPKSLKIGTIDSFQGQEAPIVIISMVVSEAQCSIKNIEFLYNRNRLNVAISRAQCLAIIVANPTLLEISCKTIKQIKMVNSLCKTHSLNETIL